MNRNAANVIRHLQARIARLEGRTASEDLGPADIAPQDIQNIIDVIDNAIEDVGELLKPMDRQITQMKKDVENTQSHVVQLPENRKEREEHIKLCDEAFELFHSLMKMNRQKTALGRLNYLHQKFVEMARKG